MPAELTLVSAFLIGLLGSTHCIGMCGGIVGAVTLGVRGASANSWSLVPFLIAYNAGRIASYTAAGALLGLLGAAMMQAAPSANAQAVARLVSGGFMVALGLYLAGWWAGLGALERAGSKLWTRIEPVGRRLLPVDRPSKALLLGLLWGWLPCGLVYAALAWSAAAGGPAQGAALMAAFGLGTLPMLFAMGATARWLGAAVRLPVVRRVAGVLVLLFGVYTLWPSPPAVHEHGHAAGVFQRSVAGSAALSAPNGRRA